MDLETIENNLDNDNKKNINNTLMKNFKKTEEYRIYIFCASYTSSIYITS